MCEQPAFYQHECLFNYNISIYATHTLCFIGMGCYNIPEKYLYGVE